MAVRVRPDVVQVAFKPAGGAEGFAVASVRKVQAPPGNGVTPTSNFKRARGTSKTVGFKKDNHKVSRRERHPCQENWDARRPMPSHGGRTVPARLGSEHVEGPRDGKSLMAGLRPAKGASLELIPFDAGTGPRQVDG